MSEDSVLHSILESARRELLDLTARNRLLNTSRSQARSSRLEIVDEVSDEVFRHLVTAGKAMSFLPVRKGEQAESNGDEEDQGQLFQPGDDELDENGLAARHIDNKLQTRLTSDRLQKRLLKLFYDARTHEEEQGVNILYLVLGFLKWYEDGNSDRERFAPLLLIPVALDRKSATARFNIRYTEDDINTNLSLQARLDNDFGIKLPDVPEIEELSPSDYCSAVATAVSGQPRWEVLPNDNVLWFFSFSKFLMYRDLDPDNWPKDRRLENHPLIGAILHEGFRDDPPLCNEDDSIDPLIHPIDMVHVLDADSSQTLVIEEVKRGRNLVIQGPPGTGKSQTIANLIAAAVKEGKSVLFVAEKMAALEVVKRRLANIGLDDMCLELHSNKAKKRAVLQDLERTLQLGQPHVDDVQRHCDELNTCRERLNQHLQIIHTLIEPSGVTPYQVVGELVRLRAAGTKPSEFKLKNPCQWSRAEFRTRLNLLRDLADHVEEIGVPHEHPWRGVEMDVVLPTDVDRVTAKIPEILARLDHLAEAGKQLARTLGVPVPADALGTSRLAILARWLDTAPLMDRRSLASPAWHTRRQHVDSLIKTGRQYSGCRGQLDDVVVEAGWDTDVTAARRNLAAHGRSWFRFFRRAYREARSTLRGILVDKLPKKLEDRLAILDCLIQGRKVRDFIESSSAAELGLEAFGSYWNGTASDWNTLSAIAKWESECREAKIDSGFRTICARLHGSPDLKPLLARIGKDLKPVLKELADLFESVRLNLSIAFDSTGLHLISLSDFMARLRRWQVEPESLSRWVNYLMRRRRLESEGVSQLVAWIDSGQITASKAVACCEMAYYEELIRISFRSHPELASFSGASHKQLLDKFRMLDEARIKLARREVAVAHFERLPTAGSDIGAVGLVRREIQKKRRHLPIRKLLAQAGKAVQAIKPVFMMSPISVAQYLEPGGIDFDLLLIDEASQVRPVDALGAVARAKKIVVVGDSKQLPPTRFFSRMAGEDVSDDAEPNELQAGDMESILGLCRAQNVPQRMLRWHYRSRHHSLIAVSNHEFYDDKLHVVPSPGQPAKGQGLHFHHVHDGVFDRGGSATNRVEAKEVAKAVMTYAGKYPDKSLGVGTFSVSQRDAILDELELLRRSDPSLEYFFAIDKAEPFFVKNLENIQGDERDSILISVGYGKDKSGYMTMNFGPLSNDGGERRLNVLITRAKECCRIFSSIQANDIDLNRARSRGAKALKSFLEYAETKLLDTATLTGKDYDSEFERQVAKALARHGYKTHPQVGVAGFFIDLAVVDPEKPGRYLLGIECDGANYHRSRSARDRDRIRQTVLEDRGWVIHRIWSTDWFHRPEEELRKTLAAIETAKVEWAGRANGENNQTTTPAAEQVEIARHDCDGDGCNKNGCLSTQPYVVASFRVTTNQGIHEVSNSELVRVIVEIIAVEGPIHREEIARRVAQLWGLQRTGTRISQAVEQGLEAAVRNAIVERHGSFFSPPNQQEVPVRDRGNVDINTLRRPDMIPPEEIRNAVSAIVRVHLGVEKDETITETARLFGFRSVSARLRQLIAREVDSMVCAQTLETRNDKLYTNVSR
jgi:very-short-patch-repair endonuclease/DNA polymerase III delta prime subunit